MMDNTNGQRLEQAIERALQQQPEIAMPADFSARVRAQLPAVRPTRLPIWRRMGAGRLAGAVALAALAIAFCCLAPGARPDFASLRFDLELVVLAEMAGVAWWVGVGSGTRG